MEIRPIKSDTDYRTALNRLDVIFDAAVGTPESDEADVLGLLVDEYEKKHYPIDAPDPIEAIKIRNRITHPKEVNDITISDDELLIIKKVNEWFNGIIKDMIEHIREYYK